MIDTKPTTVEDYIKSYPKEVQDLLREMKSLIQDAMPDATETMKWGQPAYSYETIMVAFAAHKDHANLYTTPSSIRALKNDLTEYKIGKSSIQFPYDKPLPKALIAKVIAFRVKEYREDGIKWM